MSDVALIVGLFAFASCIFTLGLFAGALMAVGKRADGVESHQYSIERARRKLAD
jgi:hypothetical protein